MNHVLYQVKGFSGNTANHQDPQNSYLNLVLETKKGNQLSLAIIYTLIAQSIDIPVYGVNLPQHFILAYLNQDKTRSDFENARNVLFYINAFNRGFVFNKNDVDFFLKQLDQSPKDEFFFPCSNKAIVLRLIHNLISSYEKLGYESKVVELRGLLSELDS
jgi:regulator of sirC expression with transglutaminase-like and TPR domain